MMPAGILVGSNLVDSPGGANKMDLTSEIYLVELN